MFQFPHACVAAMTGVIFVSPLNAEVTLSKIWSDHMVLQREHPIPVWGKAAAGEVVTVTFGSQKKSTSAGKDGLWKVQLDSLAASDQAAELVIQGTNQIILRDILVGDVWFCSGQSNMESPTGTDYKNLKAATCADPELAEDVNRSEGFPQIRLFRVEKQLQPPDVVSAGWTHANTENINPYSGVGFTFARHLNRKIGVPIGMIQAAWGGTRIEVWTPSEGYLKHPVFKKEAQADPSQIDQSPVGTHYRAMVQPIIPFPLKGVIWYQGETNVIDLNDPRYADKFEALVSSWRHAWNQPELPFYSVQLAPYAYSIRAKDKVSHTTSSLPEFWEIQQSTLAIPHTGIVPTVGLTDKIKDIHPINKRPVGERLAQLALHSTYQKSEEPSSGPIFKSLKIEKNQAHLVFEHSANGLKSADGKPLSHFEIAGSDLVFHPAEARLDGTDRVIVSSPKVSQPVHVRYGWHEAAQSNLENSEGWPAYPFRTNPVIWKSSLK